MFALIFEKGMVTLSWYAWLALRRRVSMSAIGSVIVMGIRQPFSPGFPRTGLRRSGISRSAFSPVKGGGGGVDSVRLQSRQGGGGGVDSFRLESAQGRRRGGWMGYQEAFDTPGSSPRWAMSRTHTRHRPNLR